MLPFGVTITDTVQQMSEFPEGLNELPCMTYLLKHNYPKDRVSNQFNVFSTAVDKCMLFVPLGRKFISFKREKLFATDISRLIYKEPFTIRYLTIRYHLTPHNTKLRFVRTSRVFALFLEYSGT